MECQSLTIEGAWLFTPRFHHDQRGYFLEAFAASALAACTERDLDLAQLNCSVSRKGTVRGIHAARRPPGQAKYVMCVVGEILDVVVDLRPESPTFGQWDSAVLNDQNRSAIFISEGLGHGFCVLSDSATLIYATSTAYDPALEYAVNPLDEALDLPWPRDRELCISDRDLNAPNLNDLINRPDSPLQPQGSHNVLPE
jgi:dTDP-4-dehydrorhamnose 3,5-epimerase